MRALRHGNIGEVGRVGYDGGWRMEWRKGVNNEAFPIAKICETKKSVKINKKR